MKKKCKRNLLSGTIAGALLIANVANVVAGAAPDGKTKAENLAAVINQSSEWEAWKAEWENINLTGDFLGLRSSKSSLFFIIRSYASTSSVVDSLRPTLLLIMRPFLSIEKYPA